jgi:phosphate transport system substrate-binding protein
VKPDAKIIKLVTKQRGAIGQISFAFITSKSKVKAVKPEGEEASSANANYPITRPLNIVTKGAPSGEAKAFIDWALSAEGQAVVKKRFKGL